MAGSNPIQCQSRLIAGHVFMLVQATKFQTKVPHQSSRFQKQKSRKVEGISTRGNGNTNRHTKAQMRMQILERSGCFEVNWLTMVDKVTNLMWGEARLRPQCFSEQYEGRLGGSSQTAAFRACRQRSRRHSLREGTLTRS